MFDRLRPASSLQTQDGTESGFSTGRLPVHVAPWWPCQWLPASSPPCTSATLQETGIPRSVTLPVPERIRRLRRGLFASEDSVCFERARIVTRSHQEAEGEHPALRRAKAPHATFAEMPISFRRGELLVGQRATRLAVDTGALRDPGGDHLPPTNPVYQGNTGPLS